MTSRVTFGAKEAGEQRLEKFDFTSRLATGETISTQVVTCTVYSGVDASPSSMISGSATASGAIVTQKVIGGVEGVVYELKCTITTSLAQTLELWAYLPVVPGVV